MSSAPEYTDIDVESDSVPGHLPWARSEPWVDETIPAFPTVYVPGRPDSDAELPCFGRHFEYDQEIVTASIEDACAGCPAREWCLEWALANNEVGIWAGTNHDDRRALKRRRDRDQQRTAA